MEVLKTQLYVLRTIALYSPNAHIAFLYHKHYLNMYNNKGQQKEYIKHTFACGKTKGWAGESCVFYYIIPYSKRFNHLPEQVQYFPKLKEAKLLYFLARGKTIPKKEDGYIANFRFFRGRTLSWLYLIEEGLLTIIN